MSPVLSFFAVVTCPVYLNDIAVTGVFLYTLPFLPAGAAALTARRGTAPVGCGLARRFSALSGWSLRGGLPGLLFAAGFSGILLRRIGPDEALLAKADQVLPPRLFQGLPDEGVILRVPVLDEGPLHGFFMGVGGDIHWLHGPGIQAGIVHDGGDGGGGWVEVLDLLRHIAQVPQVLRQLDGLLQRGTGVAAHEVGHHVLLHPQLLIEPLVLGDKFLIDGVGRLAHHVQHRVRHMLRRNL